MDRYPGMDRSGGHDEHIDGVELLEDRTRRIAGGRSGRRLGVSMPGAIAGAFLVAALAFGAALRPDGAAPTGAGHEGGDAAVVDEGTSGSALGHGEPDWRGEWTKDAYTGGDAEPGEEPVDEKPDAEEPTDEPKHEEPTDEPKHEEPTTAPKPALETLGVTLRLDGSKVVIDWTACDPAGFRYYKVVRSTNEGVTWPLGIGDSLVGAVEDMGKTIMVDAKAPAGKKVYYKVFGVISRDGKLVVACATPAKAITTKPAPDGGDAGTLGIEVGIVEGHPKIRWSECLADFDYYKVVRSTDSTVTWPAGSNDKVVGVVGRDGDRKVYDGDAPAGKKLWYRVFCVRSTEEGYKVLAASAAKAVQTPTAEPKPTPEPYILGFEVFQTADGVVLEWEPCGTDGFAYYKVVRSMTNTKPTFPVNDGTQVIAAFEDHTKTRFVDTKVEPGQTWYYRVYSIGFWGEQRVVLGVTPVRSLTVE